MNECPHCGLSTYVFRVLRDTKEYLRHLAMDTLSCHTSDQSHFDSLVFAEDISDPCGLCELSLDNWPVPVFVLYRKYEEVFDADPGESHPKDLTDLRAAIADLGLEELACQFYCDDIDDLYNDWDDVDEEHRYARQYSYALVVQVS